MWEIRTSGSVGEARWKRHGEVYTGTQEETSDTRQGRAYRVNVRLYPASQSFHLLGIEHHLDAAQLSHIRQPFQALASGMGETERFLLGSGPRGSG